MEPDREAEPPGGGPVELSERVVDAPEHPLDPRRANPDPLEQPPRPAEHAARLNEDEQAQDDRLDDQEPEHGVEERRAGQPRLPRHHRSHQEEESLTQGDRRLGDYHRREGRVERCVAAEQPGLDGLAADGGGRRRHVEGLAGEARPRQGAKRDRLAQEGVTPAERVEQRDEHRREAEDDAEPPVQIRDRREHSRWIVLGDQRSEQRHTEHEERDAKVAQLSFPGRG